jgi:hypothetical protein
MNKMIWPIAAVVCVAIAATGAVLVAHSLRPAAVTAGRVPRPAAVKHDPSPSPAARRHHARRANVAARPASTSTSTSAPASPEVMLLITCTGNGVFEPSSYMLACGDGNAGLSGLTWSSWTATGASGSGEYGVNDCTPDCAHGTCARAARLVMPARMAVFSRLRARVLSARGWRRGLRRVLRPWRGGGG